MKESMTRRIAELLAGQVILAMGLYLGIQANIGLAPWDAFHLGIAGVTGLSYGNVSLISGIVILVIDYLLKQPLGFGTLINATIVGKIVDLFDWLNLVQPMQSLLSGTILMIVGMELVCISTYFYIKAGMGCGPRDGLMVALSIRLRKLPIGAVRGLLEGTVLLIGFLLGAKVGIGTVIAACSISFLLDRTFRLLRFDVKSVHHQTFAETWKECFGAKKMPVAAEGRKG